jgi:hypothetical protein
LQLKSFSPKLKLTQKSLIMLWHHHSSSSWANSMEIFEAIDCVQQTPMQTQPPSHGRCHSLSRSLHSIAMDSDSQMTQSTRIWTRGLNEKVPPMPRH